MVFFVSPVRTDNQAVLGAKTYSAPTIISGKPTEPDVVANQGNTIHRSDFTVITFNGTVPFDAYLSVGCTPLTNPISIANYWQITPVCEVYFRSQHNNGKYLSPLKTSIVSRTYTVDDLRQQSGEYFRQDTIKMVKSTDGGQSWTMLRNAVVNLQNNTVSAITEANGAFMLMTGDVDADTYYNYSNVLGETTDKSLTQKWWQFMGELNANLAKHITNLLNNVFSFY